MPFDQKYLREFASSLPNLASHYSQNLPNELMEPSPPSQERVKLLLQPISRVAPSAVLPSALLQIFDNKLLTAFLLLVRAKGDRGGT